MVPRVWVCQKLGGWFHELFYKGEAPVWFLEKYREWSHNKPSLWHPLSLPMFLFFQEGQDREWGKKRKKMQIHASGIPEGGMISIPQGGVIVFLQADSTGAGLLFSRKMVFCDIREWPTQGSQQLFPHISSQCLAPSLCQRPRWVAASEKPVLWPFKKKKQQCSFFSAPLQQIPCPCHISPLDATWAVDLSLALCVRKSSPGSRLSSSLW